MVKFLLDKGAKTDAQTNFGRTALHQAIIHDGNDTVTEQTVLDMVKLLVEQGGADVNAKFYYSDDEQGK